MMDVEKDQNNLPPNWTLTSFKEIAEFKNGINFSSEQKSDQGILTIDVLNMYSKSIGINKDSLYRVNKDINKDYYLNNGDVLL